ncbi:hypothetical protein OF83DRAFT_1050227 [Amylostereum chailletii]|nr:hypothetical protein OF83DRAFT_1050227 [Amylostereum chailletii]
MAGASAADVRSILSLPTPSTPGPSQPKKPAHSARKPEGISRELYSLIGSSAPTLAAQLAKPRLKQKPNLGSGGTVKWELRTFKNAARSDSLELRHWVKATFDPDAEYPFLKYNIKSPEYTYSLDEYTRLLEDEAWSKGETDYLFQLVQDFDSRFFIIADRYDYPNGPPRTMEDLKDRYYSVCRKLIRSQPWTGDDASKNRLLTSFEFDKEREVQRKKYLQSLENRTKEEIEEEEALYIELKHLEQTERRFKAERDNLLYTLYGVESGLHNLPFDDDGPLGDPKKRKRGPEVDSPAATPSSSAMAPPAPVKRAPSVKSAVYDAQHCIYRLDPQPSSTTKSSHRAAYLRSFSIPYAKSGIAAKVTQLLGELNITHSRLVMPTRETVGALETLLEATSTLVEQKKVLDRVEQDIRVARGRLGLRASEAPSANAGGEGAFMDVDEDEGSRQNQGRGASLASTRSARSRKPVRS